MQVERAEKMIDAHDPKVIESVSRSNLEMSLEARQREIHIHIAMLNSELEEITSKLVAIRTGRIAVENGQPNT